MATNRADTLDPALLRPGRLDRKIEFPTPDRRQKRLVFQVRCRPHPPLPSRSSLRGQEAPTLPPPGQERTHLCRTRTSPAACSRGCVASGVGRRARPRSCPVLPAV